MANHVHKFKATNVLYSPTRKAMTQAVTIFIEKKFFIVYAS
jgi:hypothetical protein